MSGWLVTGGCGFVGANLAHRLLAQGIDVAVLDDLSREGSAANLQWLRNAHGSQWRFVRGDVRDAALVERIVSDVSPSALAHFAGQVAMTTSVRDPRRDFEVNALGSLNVLEAVRLKSPHAIVLYPSTNKVYGSLEQLTYSETATRYVLSDHPSGLDETLALDPESPYGCSKAAGDVYVRDYHRYYDVRSIVFRFSSMYGARQFATYDQGWVGWFCRQAVEARRAGVSSFTISGSGKQVRDLLHVEDVCDLCEAAVRAGDGAFGEAFNIGGGMENSLSLLELFSYLEHEFRVRLVYERLAMRQGDQRVFVADTSKAARVFGWRPKVSLTDGLKALVAWTQEV